MTYFLENVFNRIHDHFADVIVVSKNAVDQNEHDEHRAEYAQECRIEARRSVYDRYRDADVDCWRDGDHFGTSCDLVESVLVQAWICHVVQR